MSDEIREAFDAWRSSNGWQRPDDPGEWEAWQAALSQHPAPVAVPDGWKLVPINLTAEMIDRAWREPEFGHNNDIERMWAGALSAAPAAPAPAAQEPVAVEVMRFQLKHPSSGETHTVEFTRAEVADGLEDCLYEKLSTMVCQCDGHDDCECADYIYDFDLISAPSAAEQPDSTTSDRYRAELYDEVWQKARDMGYGNVTEALIALERMRAAEQPDTVKISRADAEVIAGFFETGGSIQLVDAGYRVAHRLRALLGKEAI